MFLLKNRNLLSPICPKLGKSTPTIFCTLRLVRKVRISPPLLHYLQYISKNNIPNIIHEDLAVNKISVGTQGHMSYTAPGSRILKSKASYVWQMAEFKAYNIRILYGIVFDSGQI